MALHDLVSGSRIASILLAATCLAGPVPALAQQSGAPPVEGSNKPAAQAPAAASDASRQDGTTRKAETRSPEDRRQSDNEAFFAARLAALHAGLTLSTDQEPLWAPVETAIRDLAKTRHGRGDRQRVADLLQEAPSAIVRMHSEQLIKRGEAMKALVDATGPLLDHLDDAQKNRLPILLQGLGPSRVLRAAFDIRYGQVVDDPDDDAGSKGNGHMEQDDDRNSGTNHHHNSRMRDRDDDSGYGAARNDQDHRYRRHDEQDDSDDRT